MCIKERTYSTKHHNSIIPQTKVFENVNTKITNTCNKNESLFNTKNEQKCMKCEQSHPNVEFCYWG